MMTGFKWTKKWTKNGPKNSSASSLKHLIWVGIKENFKKQQRCVGLTKVPKIIDWGGKN